MGSRTQDIRALTFPKTMIVKAALLCYLVLTPAVFSFTVPEVNSVAKKQSSEVEARQFSDDDIINYGIWGFIAGLSDYFIRNAVTVDKKTTTTTTTTTPTTTTAAPRFRQKHKYHKKDKKEKKQQRKDKKAKRDQKKKEKEMEMEAENAMKAEVEAVVVEESVPVEVVEDSVAEIVADVE